MHLFACSGRGAGETIGANIDIGNFNAAIMFGLLAVSATWYFIVRQHGIIAAVLAAMLILHPAWFISARMGDCGFLKRDASLIFTGAGLLLVCVQLRGVQRNHASAFPSGAPEGFRPGIDAEEYKA